MIVLDTNVISEALSRSPSQAVLVWLARQESASLRLSAVTVAEISYGIALLTESARRAALATAWEALQGSWGDRLLVLGAREAEAAGALLASRRREGRPMALGDALIAGTCLVHGCALATRNIRDFASTGLELINPWDSSVH